MNNTSKSKHYIDIVATLLIFFIFAVCIIFSILVGAKIYKSVNETDTYSYNLRTCTQYISSKVRRASSPDKVSVVDFAGTSALSICESDNYDYYTLIYFYDGFICELFYPLNDLPSDGNAGEKLLEVQYLEFSDYGDGLITSVITPLNGPSFKTLLFVRGKEAVS